MRNHKIFVSYSWKDKSKVELVERDLNNVGIKLTRDVNDLLYFDNIEEYMKLIRNSDFVLLFLSKSYFRSFSCMYELSELIKDGKFIDKIMPILVGFCPICKPKDRLKVIKFWETEKNVLKFKLEEIDPIHGIEIQKSIKQINTICLFIDELMTSLSKIKFLTITSIQKERYKPIFLKLGIQDFSMYTELVSISEVDSLEEEEIKIDEFIFKYPDSTFGYEAKGRFARQKLKLFQKAKINFNKAIELDPQNWQALYNLGNLYDEDLNDPQTSIIFYKQALNANPDCIPAYLNLAYVLNYRLNLPEESLQYLQKALSLDPNDCLIYAKIAINLDLMKESDEVIEYYYLQALKIDENCLAALFNYSGFLGVRKKDNSDYYLNKYFDLIKTGKLHSVPTDKYAYYKKYHNP